MSGALRSLPPPAQTEPSEGVPCKVVFLMLVKDAVVAPLAWQAFLGGVRGMCIHCEAGPGADLGCFSGLRIAEWHPTRWGDVSLVRAQNALLRAAMQDSEATHFFLVSGDSVPLRSLRALTEALTLGVSYFCFDAAFEPQRYQALPLGSLRRCEFRKASQWCVLARHHAEDVLTHESQALGAFRGVFAADEHLYASLVTLRFPREQTRHAELTWLELSHGRARVFAEVREVDLARLVRRGVCVLRKVSLGCLLECEGERRPLDEVLALAIAAPTAAR